MGSGKWEVRCEDWSVGFREGGVEKKRGNLEFGVGNGDSVVGGE